MNKLNKIEALRGFAALYVLIHHFNIGEGTWVKYFAQQGQIAIIMFFIISGFVLNISNRKQIVSGKLRFKEYFKKRFRRIYPVLLASMLLAYICACLAVKTFIPFNWIEFTANLLNIQDLARHPGYWFEAFAQNTPLWSLSYEWWFYMIFFPLSKYVTFERQRFYALGISIFGFFTYNLVPNQISIILEYFIIWWVGVELGESWKTNSLFKQKNLLFIYGSLFALFLIQSTRILFSKYQLQLSYFPVINILHTSFAIIIITIGLIWHKYNFKFFDKSIGYFEFFGPISYSIYLFHYPLVMKYHFPFFPNLLTQYIITLVLLYILCNLIEIRLQRYINKIV